MYDEYDRGGRVLLIGATRKSRKNGEKKNFSRFWYFSGGFTLLAQTQTAGG